MNNTLNPCKCDSGTGTGGDASDVVYDGATVDCIPVSVGQNLATVIKNLGDYVCGLDGRTQVVTVNTGAPSGGGEGDIWFRQQGSSVTVYQRISGAWVSVGDLVTSGALLQNVTVSTSTPTGGNPGDIHFKNVEGSTEVWYNNAGTWGSVGSIPTGGGSGSTYTQDQDVPNTGALSYLNSEYPDASAGDQVYMIAGGMRRTWTCYASGAWSRIDEVIET